MILKPYVSALFAIALSGAAIASDDHGGPVEARPFKPGITMTRAVQAGITPDGAITILKAGNQRFLANKPLLHNLRRRVTQTALGQFPFASVLACIDSRAAPEVVFDQSVGDIFTARVAGNIVNEDILGSLEYTAKVAGSRLIVVLGHSNCGAIKGACDGVRMGNLTSLLDKISPAVAAVRTEGERSSKKPPVRRRCQRNECATGHPDHPRKKVLCSRTWRTTAKSGSSGRCTILPTEK
ncbi:carbonic anhydrase [Candidatus Accumulibacter contiguus]|uniref:carbonic anhydrase n=1 Tax=Candidatus Accumulibacter contiguus TaxID=2954381 RepID=UPI0027E25F5F|nr:carbonic anhydrase [Candidatus Accumulibacter contiguus]